MDFWLDKGMSDYDSLGSQLFCVTLWNIWKAMNMVVFNNDKFVPLKVENDARDWVCDFNKSNLGLKVNRVVLRTEIMENEFSGMKKIFVDARCFNDGTIALGCVMKNAERGVFFSTTKRLPMETNPSVAETLAVRWALMLAVDFKLPVVLILSYVLSVVDCINQVSSVAVLEPIALDCLNLIKKFQIATLLYVNRVCNLEAHNLVDLGHRLGSRTRMGVSPSNFIRNLVPVISVS